MTARLGRIAERRWLCDIGRRGEQGVFAVGAGGIAFHYDGRTWNTDVTGFEGGLRALSASNAHGVLADGDALEVEVSGVGVLDNPIEAWRRT